MEFDRGLGCLSRHKPAEAARFLRKALDGCPAFRSKEIHLICLYLGVALRRVGCTQSAIRSWASCQRLNKHGHARKLLDHIANGYGMERQATKREDDWNAFAAAQISRYLLGKVKRRFSTAAERDMIIDLIRDHWRRLERTCSLDGFSVSEKYAMFRNEKIVFPIVLARIPGGNEPVISVDFRSKRRVKPMDRCICGSGLPFMLCCGHTPASEELLSGSF